MSKNPQDQKFIKKDDATAKEGFEEVVASEEVVEVIENLSNEINPKNNQQRNLDREIGGLENQAKKQINEVGGFEDWQEKQESEKDIWDERSEEVDRMGSHNPLGTSAKKSMIWRNKKKKMDDKKLSEVASEALLAKNAAKTKNQGFDSSKPQQGFVTNLKNLRQDRSTNFNNNNSGRSL